MAQYEVPGGGVIDSGDKRIERKVVVSTAGNPQPPGGSGRLTNIAITNEVGGLRRGIFEYTEGGSTDISGDASYNSYGKRIEFTGGTREVPIQTHPKFAGLTETQLAEVETKIENKIADEWALFEDETQQLLYNFLRKKVEYVLSPSVVGRVSEIESNLPSLAGIAKVANPSELDAPSGTFWICTAITASPVGNRFEVTREYTLALSDWEDVEALYGWSNNE